MKAFTRDSELCQGCDLCKDGKIPIFKSEEEEREFWVSHSPLDFPEEFKDVEIKVLDLRRKKSPISIRLDPILKESVKKLANIKRVKYQSLIQEWIKEKLREEERKLIKIAEKKSLKT